MRNAIKNKSQFFLLSGLASLNPSGNELKLDQASKTISATLFANLAYYGFVPSSELSEAILCSSFEEIKSFWDELQPALSEKIGESRNMDQAVVYKNFPREVLEMSKGEYWFKQIWMYLGCPPAWFAEKEVERESVNESFQKLKVLHLAKDNSIDLIYRNLLSQQSLWIAEQKRQVMFCIENLGYKISLDIPFKENMVIIAKYIVEKNISDVTMKSATDVLRLAVALCDGDISLKENTKFKFKRSVRKLLLGMLNKNDLGEDFAARKEVWKRLMTALHPFDYENKFPNVKLWCNALMQKEVKSFNSKIEKKVAELDFEALHDCATRPGVYMRNMVRFYSIYGMPAIEVFVDKVLPKLTNFQILKIQSVFENINLRTYRTFPPKGSWKHMQVQEDKRPAILEFDREVMLREIGKELKKRIFAKYGLVSVDPNIRMVKIKGNDTDLSPYGRGTIFPIPKEVKFIRTASYWEIDRRAWFDNGINFFSKDWNEIETCCWTNVKTHNSGAIFSGDPVITHTKKCACQMIDLYPNQLRNEGIRYAVWNILCFSKIPFKDAGDVFASMQWGENAQRGKLFEPARCQLSFPVGGDCYAKYILCFDLERMEVIYLDAPLAANVSSAEYNVKSLERNMPPFMEYVETLPSLYDLFKHAEQGLEGIPIVYSDVEKKISGGKAYVFKPENKDNSFKNIGIDKLIE